MALLANVGRWGFYRVHYEGGAWALALEALRRSGSGALSGNAFSVDVAGMVVDALALSDAGVSSAVRVLEAIDALLASGRDLEYAGHSAALWAAGQVHARMVAACTCEQACGTAGPTGGTGAPDRWLAAVAGAVPAADAMLASLSVAPPGLIDAQRLVWPTVVLAAGRASPSDAPVLAMAWEVVKKRLDAVLAAGGDLATVDVPGSEGYIHPDVRAAAYALAVRHRGQEAFTLVWRAVDVVGDPAEKAALLAALAEGPTDALVREALALTLDSRDVVRGQDVAWMVEAVAEASPLGRLLAWEFVRTRLGDIRDKIGRVGWADAGVSELVQHVASGFSDQVRVQEIEHLQGQYPDLILDQVVEYVRQAVQRNRAWLQANGGDVCAWMKAHTPN